MLNHNFKPSQKLLEIVHYYNFELNFLIFI